MRKGRPEPPASADAAQSRRFIAAARELGCDEDEARFDEKLKRLRTVEMIQAELAAAQKELANWKDRFDRYSGNNPNKYQNDIRQAASTVSRLKEELAAAERKRP